MHPEEKFASRLLKRHGLVPKYDLMELAKKYADISYMPFPVDADGIVLGLKQKDRPEIIINNRISETRQKFTLAHELGHVVIPWHIGNIVSHADIDDSSDRVYKTLESEANRFAAELLIPTSWVKDKFKNRTDLKSFLHNICTETGASREAVFIKIFNCLPAGFSCLEVDDSGTIYKSYASKGTPNLYNNEGIISLDEIKKKYHAKAVVFSIGDKSYVAIEIDIKNKVPKVTMDKTWREIFDIIIGETKLKDKAQRINAVLGSCYDRSKTLDDNELFKKIIFSYTDKDDLVEFVRHPLFEQYVAKRIADLRSRRQ